ncbi:restriction endonuclease subunit S [Vibrio navarrensis]|nr:restriction endonuclease subunit S [Vibrio navarrensis]
MSATEHLVPDGYKQTEVGVIPDDWGVSSFDDISSLIGDGIHTTPNYDENGDFYFVNGNNLVNGSISLDGNTKKTNLTEYKKHKKPLDQRTLLLSINGTIGNVAEYNNESIVLGKSAAFINVKKGAEKKYIFYVLGSHRTKLSFFDGLTGSTIKNLGLGTIRTTLLPLPPEKEQIAIANALSDVDALISELEKLIAKKQAIKTATMQQLLTGHTRLPQFALREDSSSKGTKPSELGEIPEDWEVKTYGEVFTFLSTSTNSRADLSEDGDFGYVHYGDIHTEWNNKLDLNIERLPRISKNIVSSAFVMDGDLIMADASEDYEGIGKTVEVFNVGDKQLVAGLHTFLLRDKEKVLADGFRGYLHSIPAVKSSFDRLATGMKVYGISKNNLSSVCIPVPSLEEQTAIATILSDMDAEIQALEQRLGKTRQIKQGMMQELLTGRVRLISGELKMDNGK